MKTKTVYYALLRYERQCRNKLQKLTAMKRFALFFLFISLFQQVNANVYAQGININVQQESLENVLNILKRQSEYSFIWGDKQMEIAKKVTVSLKNVSLKEAMELVMINQPLDYTIEERRKLVIIRTKHTENENLGEAKGVGIDPIELNGRITNEKGEPVIGATVIVKGTSIITTTNSEGYFTIRAVDNKATLLITSVGYETKLVKLMGDSKIEIKMVVTAQNIKEVIVKGSTGYQTISKDNPGAFDVISNELINRSVGSNILDRIENLSTGVSFKNANDGILIRGRNSIFSNVNPLIILDNFPYDGDINNVNPNDIEDITILKDAAAAALWGAKAGNGVIVITSKRGKTNKLQVNLNTNLNINLKPDLLTLNRISSSDEIELEKYLFDKGYYNAFINNTFTRPPLTPVVEILQRKKLGQISESEANSQIESLKKYDVRDDLMKYFYRNGVDLQNSINFSGNTPGINYYLSVGWDRSLSNLVGDSKNRISLKSRNTFKISSNISLDAGITYTQNNDKKGGNLGLGFNSAAGKGLYPYARLVDENGKALSIVRQYRNSFTDTVGRGQILDWKYKPYDEINATTRTLKLRDFLINIGLKVRLLKGLDIEALYQFENSLTDGESLYSIDSYFTRELINQFYQPSASNKFPIPIGGIIDQSNSELLSHQGRLQGTYNKSFNNHKIEALAGWEIKNLENTGQSFRLYGYNKEGNVVASLLDYVNRYPQYQYGIFASAIKSLIPNPVLVTNTVDRFISYYANINYEFDSKYRLSVNARNDAANLFGVSTNQKGVPLWSIGASWKISDESFLRSSTFFNNLSLRTTYGSNGNFSRFSSAYTTATFDTYTTTGALRGTILTPPNRKLTWEQVKTFNIGLDFSILNERLSGSVDVYSKKIKNLIGEIPLDPTTGLTPPGAAAGTPLYYGNVAEMRGKGMEVTISTLNVNRRIRWSTNFLFSYAQTEVSKYLLPVYNSGLAYAASTYAITPIVGKPIFSLFSFPWAGLDPSTGEPMGYLGKTVSKDYSTILSTATLDSLVFNGPSQPPYFGAIRNTIEWKNFSFSFNISYKFGYYFLKNSLSYLELFTKWTGSGDYAKRWQKPGDEIHSNVPSLIYPIDGNKEQFYAKSSAQILRGDNIRLEDIYFSYSIDSDKLKTLPIRKVKVYATVSNIALLYLANSEKIDPYVNGSFKIPRRISIGLNVVF